EGGVDLAAASQQGPDALDGVEVGCVGRQEVAGDPVVGVLIRASVHVWSGQPCASGPVASSCSSTQNRASLSLGRDTGPAELSPSAPTSCQARRQRCTERTLTRKSLATSALEAPAANRSAASSRIRSRNACRSGVSPPPCGYLTQPAYRDDHTSSAPN